MSKRFEQLAVEAGLIASVYNGFDRARLTKAEMKFADMIVRECCQVIERRYKYSNGTPMSFWEMSQDVQHLLNTHFGIKDE